MVNKILKGDEVRVRRQPESSEADRFNDSAECAGTGGQNNTVRSKW
jgi:hypothetical protein